MGLKNEFEIVVVNEPSVVEPLKIYCISFIYMYQGMFSEFSVVVAMRYLFALMIFYYKVALFKENDVMIL